MSAALDPISQNFVNASSKEPPLHEKTYPEARELLEAQQQHEPGPDIKEYTIDVPFDTRTVPAVLFRSHPAKRHVPVILYTHGGGMIRGRLNHTGVPSITNN
ncbi:alpha/beta hydrolase fold protein [Aspergillus sp. HF37]|nr:alpha/beta hydrolase fold protein [Aspergillus sp. HF37]